MKACLDASVVVALLTRDPHSPRAEAVVSTHCAGLLLSDLSAAEFASVMARRVRKAILTAAEADAACDALDRWAASAVEWVEATSFDIRRAAALLRRRDLDLRTQDATHIGITDRLGAALATFDKGMAAAGRALRIRVRDA